MRSAKIERACQEKRWQEAWDLATDFGGVLLKKGNMFYSKCYLIRSNR